MNSASEIIKKLKENNNNDNTVVNKIVKDLGDGRLVETIEIVTEEEIPEQNDNNNADITNINNDNHVKDFKFETPKGKNKNVKFNINDNNNSENKSPSDKINDVNNTNNISDNNENINPINEIKDDKINNNNNVNLGKTESFIEGLDNDFLKKVRKFSAKKIDFNLINDNSLQNMNISKSKSSVVDNKKEKNDIEKEKKEVKEEIIIEQENKLNKDIDNKNNNNLKQKRMNRAMERIKKKRDKTKDAENDQNNNNDNNKLFKSARIKNLVSILEEQMGEKGIELGGKEKSNEVNNNNDNNNINIEKIEDNKNEGKIINKKKMTKKTFEE